MITEHRFEIKTAGSMVEVRRFLAKEALVAAVLQQPIERFGDLDGMYGLAIPLGEIVTNEMLVAMYPDLFESNEKMIRVTGFHQRTQLRNILPESIGKDTNQIFDLVGVLTPLAAEAVMAEKGWSLKMWMWW